MPSSFQCLKNIILSATCAPLFCNSGFSPCCCFLHTANTDINQIREAAVGENRDLVSLIQCISLVADVFWHWSHSHWNCIFLLLQKSTAFLSPKSYLPSFHNRNLIKSWTKQPLMPQKVITESGWNVPKFSWTWSDERRAQNTTQVTPNWHELSSSTFMQYPMHMNRWERNPAFSMLQSSVLWGIHQSKCDQFLSCCVEKLARTASN